MDKLTKERQCLIVYQHDYFLGLKSHVDRESKKVLAIISLDHNNHLLSFEVEKLLDVYAEEYNIDRFTLSAEQSTLVPNPLIKGKSMQKWIASIDIKKIINNYECSPNDDLPCQLRQDMLEELKKIPKQLHNKGDDSDSLKELKELMSILEDKSDIAIVADFDNWLTELYDWADENNVWLGL